jgi:hypothetical protein
VNPKDPVEENVQHRGVMEDAVKSRSTLCYRMRTKRVSPAITNSRIFSYFNKEDEILRMSEHS